MLENGARVNKHPLRGSGAVPPGCEVQGAEGVSLEGAVLGRAKAEWTALPTRRLLKLLSSLLLPG